MTKDLKVLINGEYQQLTNESLKTLKDGDSIDSTFWGINSKVGICKGKLYVSTPIGSVELSNLLRISLDSYKNNKININGGF